VIYRFGDAALNTERMELTRNGETVATEPLVYRLIVYLIENRDRVVSKDELIENVWGRRVISDGALNTCINGARTSLGDDGKTQATIKTFPRRGFRFVADLEESEAEAVVAPAAPELLPDNPSIAVMPFDDLSAEKDQGYFADGLVEEIITSLCRLKWLFVIARNSSFIYKGQAVDVRQVGRELGVRYVLEGSVRKGGQRLRINAQLVDTATGSHLWADKYDGNIDDVFDLQDQITLAVVAAIEPNLRAAEIEHVKRKRPDSLDAYDLVLRALPEVSTCMPAGAESGLTFLARALAHEPNYPLAHGLAAWAHEILFVRRGMKDEDRQGAIEHAHAAIAHGRSDPMALTLGAFSIALVEHDHEAAIKAFEEAVTLCPYFAPVYIFGSGPLSFAGHAERAIDWGEQGIRLSPFDPLINIACHGICVGNFHLSRDESAVDAARRAIQSNPGFSFSYALLAAPLARLGRAEEARAAVAKLCELQPNFSISRQCAAVGIVSEVADPLIKALRSAGLSV
jgi:TolB-like protein